jgi:hypothetical protein
LTACAGTVPVEVQPGPTPEDVAFQARVEQCELIETAPFITAPLWQRWTQLKCDSLEETSALFVDGDR